MKQHKTVKLIFLFMCLVLILSTGGFLWYVNDYYPADDIALSALASVNTHVVQNGNLVLSPTTPTDTALIFYPGAKVEYTAYLPILEQIQQRCGITCILVKMPFNMAIFNANAAKDIMAEFPAIKNWYIGGHSMGGAMASSYASQHPDTVKGLILMGAYVYGTYPPSKALTLYGTFNANLEKNIHYTENIVVIDGGNHAQFGNYGKQKGDPEATISAKEQQTIAVDAIQTFLQEVQ